MPQTIEVKIPDIGDFKEVAVIEVLVKPGDVIKAEDSIVTLESEKASMDVPSPAAGSVKEVKVKVGDMVAEGTVVLLLEASDAKAVTASKPAPAAKAAVPVAAPAPEPAVRSASTMPAGAPPVPGHPEGPTAPPAVVLMPGPAEFIAASAGGHRSHATPSVRRFARELGVDISKVKGSGPKGRILQQDVQAFVKAVLSGARPAAAGALDLLPWPKVDFAKFGSFETRPLSRIQKLSGANLARNWVMMPHVTQFDEADITALEQFRVAINQEAEQNGVKVTVLAFLVKASVDALKQFPVFNSSLDGENLIVKHYYHIGFAADTPNGLVVPVIRNADQKSLLAIAREAGELARKAREGKLSPAEMQGGCFSISSLGGIGGTAFTPIINAPEVAILGVSRADTKPKWDGKRFAPRLMLPLSLSYDHRVIDGAAGARFITYLGQVLAGMREALQGEFPARKKQSSPKRKAPKLAGKKSKAAGKKKKR
ncbi:MAG TPA: dihydrolipoyllysine-residue acetyltransferase [Acidiferrobacterales bacterium]|nr:dihydrolipoyllysine-residue acetyltransferase [Acidiferrobacterales bacterium]